MSATPSVFDKPLDGDINDVAEGLVILVDGDTAPRAISSGQYLFIKNHTTLATGGYHATAAIGSGDAVSSSNVAADADGIVNAAYSALNGNLGSPSSASAVTGADAFTKINSLNSKLKSTRNALTGADSGITQNGIYVVDESTRTVRIYCSARSSSNITMSSVLGNIPAPYRPTGNTGLIGFFATDTGVSATFLAVIDSSGNIKQNLGNSIREAMVLGEYIY